MSAASTTASANPQVSFTAGAVARMLNIPPSTLRAWHRRYDLRLSDEQTGTHRRYSGADVDALARMSQLIAEGVSAESAALLAFRPAIEPVGTTVEEIVAVAARLDAETLLALLAAHLAAHGAVDTWNGLCRPALHAFGGPDARTPSSQCVDVVHLLSWAITAALHRVPTVPAPAARSVLLAGVEGERHTLPLEALRAALAQHGVPARLLGGSVPLFALRAAISRSSTPPVALVLWAHTPDHPPLRDLAGLVSSGTRLVLSGPGWIPGRRPASARPETLDTALELLIRVGRTARSRQA